MPAPLRLIVTNFQSIPHAEFDLNGFTCLTGPSNLGKSAVVRALRAILTNDLTRR